MGRAKGSFDEGGEQSMDFETHGTSRGSYNESGPENAKKEKQNWGEGKI